VAKQSEQNTDEFYLTFSVRVSERILNSTSAQ